MRITVTPNKPGGTARVAWGVEEDDLAEPATLITRVSPIGDHRRPPDRLAAT